MSRFLIVMTAAAAAFPGAAEAADWYRVGRNHLAVTYTDLETAARAGPDLQVWEYAIWFAPNESGMIRAKSRLSIRCQDRSYQELYSTVFYQNGESDSGPSEDARRRFAAPDTTVENLILFHCGNTQRGSRLVGVTPEEDARRQAP